MTSQNHTLLVEVGCEELPPKALAKMTESFFEQTCKGLSDLGIGFDREASHFYYTPRRMALSLAAVTERQADRVLERKGPAVKAAFDDSGKATPAALGFAKSVGLEVEALDRIKTDKGEWLACQLDIPGKPLCELLFDLLADALRQLPVPKPMRWSDHDFEFVRPVHWLLVLHGDQVINGELYGCQASDTTAGHRIHAPGPHRVASADDYLATLERAFVIADHERRREHIHAIATASGEEIGGATRITDALLKEVNNLVEWPVAVRCSFGEAFLAVPQEALIQSMESHQKFFPILALDDTLTPDFVVIANIESQDVDAMTTGFQRVIRPRLADAQFFWEQDLKQPLEAWLPALDKIVFQEKLGSVGDKSRRIESLSKKIAELVGADVNAAGRAGRLAKADLVSLMVGEFPDLQGIMGGYYARHAGESDAVADAISEHYAPRFAGDHLPASKLGRITALADRLDTLTGIFAAGLKPSGNKDPFALRRAALAVVRLLEEGGLSLALKDVLTLAEEGLVQQQALSGELRVALEQFIYERLRSHLRDTGASTRQIEAVLAAPLGSLPDLRARLLALKLFMGQDESASLVAANKRIGNILKKQDSVVSEKIDTDRLVLDEERDLYHALIEATALVEPLYEERNYETALATLSTLRVPVDAFFDSVMVLDEDPAVRGNRLAMLKQLKALFDRVADFAQAD